MFPPMPWPHSIPADLRPLLDAVLSKRNCGPAEIWGEVRDWLEAHHVEMPPDIAQERGIEGAQRDQ